LYMEYIDVCQPYRIGSYNGRLMLFQRAYEALQAGLQARGEGVWWLIKDANNRMGEDFIVGGAINEKDIWWNDENHVPLTDGKSESTTSKTEE
jgi:hypothetical protein